MKEDWIAKLKKLAESNYHLSYGWQVFVECYDKEDWLEFVEDVSSFEEAEKLLNEVAEIQQERYQEAVNEIF